MSRPRYAFLSCALLMSLVPALPVHAQVAIPVTAPALDAATRRALVEAFARAMREHYVYPEKGEQVAAVTTAAFASAKYDSATTTVELLRILSAEATAITHDKHLSLFSAQQPQLRTTPREVPTAEAGITRADKLGRGIGYIEIIGFPPSTFSKLAIARAMSALNGSRALIIDIRRNGGGDSETVSYFISFLVEPGQPINDIVSRIEKTNRFSRQSFSSVPTPVSFRGVPVYVLTSSTTFSAGEEFAYDLQALKRATLIGEVTGGGANPVRPVDLGYGVTAMIPFGRSENPATKTNWEGVGVQPDVLVTGDAAFSEALKKFGLKPVNDIASASISRVFGSRTSPIPGSKAAVRKFLNAIVNKKSLKGITTANFASEVEPSLSKRRVELTSLGKLRTIEFYRPDGIGGDEYKLTFAHGRRKMALVVGADGELIIASPLMPLDTGD